MRVHARSQAHGMVFHDDSFSCCRYLDRPCNTVLASAKAYGLPVPPVQWMVKTLIVAILVGSVTLFRSRKLPDVWIALASRFN
jgi:hypothetical protein